MILSHRDITSSDRIKHICVLLKVINTQFKGKNDSVFNEYCVLDIGQTYTYRLDLFKVYSGCLLGLHLVNGSTTLAVHGTTPGAGQREGGARTTVVLEELADHESLPKEKDDDDKEDRISHAAGVNERRHIINS